MCSYTVKNITIRLSFLMSSQVCQVSLKRCSVAPRYSALTPLRRCHLPGLSADGGCEALAVLGGSDFELNRYGQETTGRRRCLEETRRLKGDSFVYSVGPGNRKRFGTMYIVRTSI